MKKLTTKKLATAGVIAGLYSVISLITFPIASGAVQIRLSEALCLLPLFFIEAVPALFIGCALSNLITGCALFDIVLGSLITLISAIMTYVMGRTIKLTPIKLILGGVFPVVFNALGLPLIWVLCYGAIEYLYHVQAIILFIGQAISIYGLGIPLYFSIKKAKSKN